MLVAAAVLPAQAYIGPGAGFAFASSLFVTLLTLLAVIATLVAWPFRMAWRALTVPAARQTSIARVVVVGFDGQDPTLTDAFMREGLLPHFSDLAASGSYRRLATTFPSVSPVAWSSFSTGSNPARHNIFDFLDRDRRTYLPQLSTARVAAADRFLTLGRYRIPLRRPEIRRLRKSKPFWTILGEHRIWSTILRVPITFPPDRFYGAQLSAMSVPDLLGTQGTFLLFTTRPAAAIEDGGRHCPLIGDGDRLSGTVPGPPNAFRRGEPALSLAFDAVIDRSRRQVRVRLGKAAATLAHGELSPWLPLSFSAAPGIAVRGQARLLVTELDDHVSVYMSAINLDPESPAMPLSHPPYYAPYLAKRIGPFATLGLAEDTSALNAGVTSADAFLQQTCDIDREREAMLFTALDRLRRGCLVCVFDATDRIQHMFWRDIDSAHPARAGQPPPAREAIRDLYRRNDALIGRLRKRLGPNDVLMVISDHGFSSFRRGVNLNQWLLREGYLTLKPGADGRAEWLRDVDWSATRAYALGLSGLFLNLRGREAEGIVEPAAAAALKREIREKLSAWQDHERATIAINEAFDTSEIYSGPYAENAPDLIIGYNAGYRVSWDGARGMVSTPLVEDNLKAWSGDHSIDPRLVPGVFFCNRQGAAETPALVDIAPTVLRLFGIDPPAYMDGRPIAGVT